VKITHPGEVGQSHIHAAVYYLPGTTNWFTPYGGLPVVLWDPSIQTSNANFRVRTNRFGFTITGTTNIPIVIEVSTNLSVSNWNALQSCTLTNSSIHFGKPIAPSRPSEGLSKRA
jgi:hypothetical protein